MKAHSDFNAGLLQNLYSQCPIGQLYGNSVNADPRSRLDGTAVKALLLIMKRLTSYNNLQYVQTVDTELKTHELTFDLLIPTGIWADRKQNDCICFREIGSTFPPRFACV